MQQQGSTSIRDFDIHEKLGEGAFSSVYRVTRKSDNQIYALKKVKMGQLNEREKINSVNEIRILASINHPFIVGYKEAFFCEITQCLCIVQEYAAGGDMVSKMASYAKKKQLIDEETLWVWIYQMVEGLRVLHSMNILHRDLKAANIFLTKDEQHIMLGDLNVSKVTKKNQMAYTQTGTPYYASPEIWKDNPYNSKSDIWSLGCVIYELSALRPPFRAQTMEGLYRKISKCQYDSIPSKYSDDLLSLINQCLQLNPNARPNCEQLLKHPGILKRADKLQAQLLALQKKYNIANQNQFNPNCLINTIRLPKNLKQLQERLPKPSYNLQSISPLNGFDDVLSKRSPRSKSIDQNNYNSQRPASRNGSKDKRAILAPIKLEDDNVRVSPTIQSNKQAYDLNKGRGRPQSPKRLASLCNKENIPANHNNNNGNCNYNNIPSGKVQNKAFQNVQTPSSVLQSKDKNSQPVKAIFYDQNQNQNFNKIKITSSRRMKSSDNRKTNNNNNNNNNVSIFKNHQGDPQSIKNQLR